jgi:uncharacterized membrane protein (DUF106 family)
MMSDIVIVAVITGIFSVIGQWLISREREIRLDERLKSVEKKLDEHNGYAQKFEKIQIDITKISTKLESMEEKV